MATITINIPDKHAELVLEMLKKSSGKEIRLSSDLIEVDGKFNYNFKSDGETDLEFANRAMKSILLGIVEWGLLVKDSNRYKQELRYAQDSIAPVSVDMPNDL